MATRKKRSAPARTRKPRSPRACARSTKKTRGHHHPELWGLGLVALGLVLATFVWLGWDGGPDRLASSPTGSTAALGAAAPLVPLALIGDRRADARPQRARRPAPLQDGARGRRRRPADRARRGSRRRRSARRSAAGSPGSSAAPARSSSASRSCSPACCSSPAPPPERCSAARVSRPAGRAARRAGRSRGSSGGSGATSRSRTEAVAPVRADAPGPAGRRGGGVPGRRRPEAVLGRAAAAAAARGRTSRGDDRGRKHGARLRRAGRERRLPPARPRAAEGEPARPRRRDGRERAHRRGPRPGASQLRRRGDDRRHDLRPARRPLRAPARAGDEGLEGRRAEGRPLVRARDHRDPDPRPDPGQAGGRRRGTQPRAAHGDARRHLRRSPGLGEPALGLARQGHLRERRLDRPRAHAAPPHRRHHGLGEVGLHQHAADLDPAPRDARRRADDPHRPEADRAQLLRVDPAPPDAGRLEPEGGVRGPPQRRRRDGAPLRAPVARSARGTCPRRTASSGPAARTRSRTCSS